MDAKTEKVNGATPLPQRVQKGGPQGVNKNLNNKPNMPKPNDIVEGGPAEKKPRFNQNGPNAGGGGGPVGQQNQNKGGFGGANKGGFGANRGNNRGGQQNRGNQNRGNFQNQQNQNQQNQPNQQNKSAEIKPLMSVNQDVKKDIPAQPQPTQPLPQQQQQQQQNQPQNINQNQNQMNQNQNNMDHNQQNRGGQGQHMNRSGGSVSGENHQNRGGQGMQRGDGGMGQGNNRGDGGGRGGGGPGGRPGGNRGGDRDMQDRDRSRGGGPRGGGGGGGPRGSGGGGGGGNFRNDDFFIGQRLRAISGPTHELPQIETNEETKFSGRNRLYVGNLTNDINEEELREMFKPYGEIGEVFCNAEKNFTFLKLDYHANAEKAKRELDGINRKGRQLRIRFAPNATILRVSNLTPFVSNELLYRSFEVFGPIERASIIVDDRGKHTGEGIVEFSKKSSANACMRFCNEKCFFLTASLRPCVVETFESNDDPDGLPDKSLNKKSPEFNHERSVGPRFAENGSFEHEYGSRWKQLHELYKSKQDALKRELKMEEEKLEAQMEYARYEHETELLRQELRKRESDNERKKMEWEMREKQAEEMRKRDEDNMRRQQTEMTSRMMRQEEEMRRRQQENTLFMQAQQLNSLLDQQEGGFGGNANNAGGGGGGGGSSGANFNDNFGGANSPFEFRGNNNSGGGNSGPNNPQQWANMVSIG